MLKIKKIKKCYVVLLQSGLLFCPMDSGAKVSAFRERCIKKGFIIPSIKITNEYDSDDSKKPSELQSKSSTDSRIVQSSREELYHFENDCIPAAIGFVIVAGYVLFFQEVRKVVSRDGY